MKPFEFIDKLDQGDFAQIVSIISDATKRSPYPIGPGWSEAQILKECAEGISWALRDSSAKVLCFVLARDVGVALEITYLATAADALRRGLMKSLIGTITARLPAEKAIWLEVHEANLAAQHLYENSGFKRVNIRSQYYADGGAAILYNYG